MGNRIIFEWLVEELEDGSDDADIREVYHFDNYGDAIVEFKRYEFARIGVVRDRGNDVDGLIDRMWAYCDADGNLPAAFDYGGGEETGIMVPKRFQAEIDKAAKEAA